MKKLIPLIVLASIVALMVSCTTTTPVCATSNPVGNKVGVASTTYLFYMFPIDNNGNAGIQKAALNGGIKKISTVDWKVEIVIPSILTKYSCVVTGD